MGTYNPRKASKMKYRVAVKNGPTITVNEDKMMTLQDFYHQCFMAEHVLVNLRTKLDEGTLSSVSIGNDEYTTLELDEYGDVIRMVGEIKGFGKKKYPVYFHKVDLHHLETVYEHEFKEALAKWTMYKEGTVPPEELEDICAPTGGEVQHVHFAENEWRWFHTGSASYLHGSAIDGNVTFEDIGRDPIETMDHSEGGEDWSCPCPYCN